MGALFGTLRLVTLMRRQTAVVVVLLVGLLGGVGFVTIGSPVADTGTLTEQWVSDTPRETQVNHHAIGVGPDGGPVVAPVLESADKPLTDTSCSLVRLEPATGAVRWRASIPAEDCYTHGLTEPAIADVDGDGDLEVVSGTTADDATLIAYDGDSGEELFRVPFRSYAGYGRPTVGNVTADAGPEIVAVDIGGNVVLVDGDGTVLWRRTLEGTTYAPPVVDDVDTDGTAEVVIGTRKGTVVLAPDGERERQSDRMATTLAHADVDDDEAMELFVTGADTVTALDGRDMTVQWEESFERSPRLRGVATGGDDPVVYVGAADQRVVALSATDGQRLWETEVGGEPGPLMPAPRAGDLDGDGRQEVVAVTIHGTVAVLDAETGSELAAYERDVPVWVTPSLADLDGDGDLEILARYGDGRVVALDYEQ
jgi:outer membrane protein assembly factor BamB